MRKEKESEVETTLCPRCRQPCARLVGDALKKVVFDLADDSVVGIAHCDQCDWNFQYTA